MASANNLEDCSILAFDAALYSFDALQRAAYRLSDRIAIHIDRCEDKWILAIQGSDGGKASAVDIAMLRTHVNDYSLRERIRSETAVVRNLILALAFSGLESSILTETPDV